MSKYNEWLSVAANIGVLLGMLFIIIELQQTQDALLANSGTLRAQMMSENNSILIDNNYLESQEKIAKGEELSIEEIKNGREFIVRMLRHWENMHFQRELGLLDDEAWEASSRGMQNMRNTPIFELAMAGWPDNFLASVHRESFLSYFESLKN
ncbi:MAG: hypothetical protein O2971_19800 [Proteobacteria bacterium]|nr:hypothetical protein [Pseudomonadota bacterium]